jgi:alpha-beta hydrolase superfamily lysophospholipase
LKPPKILFRIIPTSFFRKAAAKEVYIVAHSYGGVVTVALATEKGMAKQRRC